MTRTQIETALRKDTGALLEKLNSETRNYAQAASDALVPILLNRICLELAREGYTFEKRPNWKPL